MKRIMAIIAAAALVAAGCGQGKGKAPAPSAEPVREFPVIQIPGMYTDPAEREAYAVQHYWDRFFSGAEGFLCDSSTVCGVPRDVLEGHFSTFAAIINNASADVGRKGMETLFSKAEAAQRADSLSNVLSAFSDLAEHYLYDPNSPFRNEDLYLPFVKGLSESPLTDPGQAGAYAFTARTCAMNAVGTPAADFVFKDASGRTRRLYDIKADYTLLFFSNPGCEACRSIIDELTGRPSIDILLSSGALAVVNVYIDGDLDAWREYQGSYPGEWYNGYDPTFTIRQDLLYHVRAIPSLYLLDAGKRVILKDAPEERVFAFLGSMLGE